jgi:hypothetical protein
LARLWSGIFAGPIAWTLQMTISYPIAQLSCHADYRSQHPATLQLIGVAALVVIALGVLMSFSVLRTIPRDAPSDGGHSRDRAKFMALYGLASAALFSLLVIATAMPSFVVHACQ